MANGIDVFTAYQTVTDWHAVRAAGYEFAYVKASDGTTTRDTGNYGSLGTAAGVAMGAYHYAQPGDPVAQANLLVDCATAGHLLTLAPALDLESPFVAGQYAIDFAIAFLRQVRARGQRPALYANNSMLATVRGPVLAAVPETLIWLARYGGTPTVDWDVWQWSDAGTVPGIQASAVDLSRGVIPFNSVAPVPTPFVPLTSTIDEETTMIVPAGTNEHIVLPCAGRPQYWYLYSSYGRKVVLHQVDYVMPTTGATASFAPGGTSTDWTFDPDRPGPIKIPTLNGNQPAGVSIRYTADYPFTLYCG